MSPPAWPRPGRDQAEAAEEHVDRPAPASTIVTNISAVIRRAKAARSTCGRRARSAARSGRAKMKAITPAKEMPPDQRTAASGTLPTEQTKLSTAISGPTMTFSSDPSARGASSMKQAVEEVVAQQADEPGEQEAERDLLPEHLPVAAEVVGDVRPGRGRAQSLAPTASAPSRPCGAGARRPPR